MRFWQIIIIILFSLILQITLCPVIRFNAVSPNLILIDVVIIGTHLRMTRAGLMGAFTGILVDLLSGETIGPYLTTFLLCGALAGILGKKMQRQHWLSTILLTMLGTLVEGFVIGLWSGHGPFLPILKYIIFPGIVYNAVICVLVTQVMDYFFQPDFIRPMRYEN